MIWPPEQVVPGATARQTIEPFAQTPNCLPSLEHDMAPLESEQDPPDAAGADGAAPDPDGAALGTAEGTALGAALGTPLAGAEPIGADPEGAPEGTTDGAPEPAGADGATDIEMMPEPAGADPDGAPEGAADIDGAPPEGAADGAPEGIPEGPAEGAAEPKAGADPEGAPEGAADGAATPPGALYAAPLLVMMGAAL